jgi:hypothetical protein
MGSAEDSGNLIMGRPKAEPSGADLMHDVAAPVHLGNHRFNDTPGRIAAPDQHDAELRAGEADHLSVQIVQPQRLDKRTPPTLLSPPRYLPPCCCCWQQRGNGGQKHTTHQGARFE